jgi:hypothetical protein
MQGKKRKRSGEMRDEEAKERGKAVGRSRLLRRRG